MVTCNYKINEVKNGLNILGV
ncbi:hypothetical protein CNEO4_1030019 [Clostridium neonatale]|uniref:Uncharacterized protein n=1 Tax=Clostridium neonatale TaxID=137838 RepID=A0AA86JNX1_9CLOT|nr:hypothetical protein CNEO_42183 [Clostridium neonatale]CAG9713186.1 hypothetical protein CNEO_520095 [Clostridium neonatale]CAG9719476.1 hypothetical protein CNEO_910029 [Clostridium neonatale]CAI3195212.1 hypothetical protein CNEO2_140067 [Clostridium neonatale]CAI3196736.1 hypothetical protein CNEO2_200058 [Clostridium neonatale]